MTTEGRLIAGDITGLLRGWRAGERAARDRLFELIYPQLRALAARRLPRSDRRFVDTRDILHEAYLRLSEQQPADWLNREQFFAVAATVVRRVVVDQARLRRRLKRGHGVQIVCLDDAGQAAQKKPLDLVALDDALGALAQLNPLAARLVDLRYFGGLTLEEAAAVLGLGRATVVRTWRVARAFLAASLDAAPLFPTQT
jgi:RNA polymerase sigma factor (TIGR02999 family)